MKKKDNQIAYCTHKDFIDRKKLKEMADKGVKHLVAQCTGLDRIDMNAAEGFGIKVHNIPGYSTNAVAQHSVWMALELMRPEGFKEKGIELEGKKVFIIGYGRIGKKIRQYLDGFACQVNYHDIQHSETRLMEYLKTSDVIFLAMSLNSETRWFLKRKHFKAMKEGVVVVNCARYELIDYSVFDLMWDKRLRLGVDEVFDEGDWARLSNVSGLTLSWTPHNAYFTKEALEKKQAKLNQVVKKIEKELK